MEPDIIPIATTAGGAGVVFSREERERHVYIVGKSGSGKSTFLFNLAMGDILSGEGVAVIDPHGDLALDILDAIPHSRINDVCYLDVTDAERPVGFNPATRVPPERRALAAAGIVSAFKHLWSDSWGPRLEHFLFHGVAALVSREHATLIDLPRVYTDDSFRDRLLRSVEDPETLRFWHEEFPSYAKAFRSEAFAPILNKVGQVNASPQLRLILGQVAPRLDLKFTMDHRRILIANLAKGAIPVTILTAAVGTGIFVDLSKSQNSSTLVVIGVASLAASLLSALQTFLNYSERASAHASAAAKYGPLRRRIEMIATSSCDETTIRRELQVVQDEWENLDETAPVLAQRFHDYALNIVVPVRAAERALAK
jgi:hypothetical protein